MCRSIGNSTRMRALAPAVRLIHLENTSCHESAAGSTRRPLDRQEPAALCAATPMRATSRQAQLSSAAAASVVEQYHGTAVADPYRCSRTSIPRDPRLGERGKRG